MEEQHLCYLSEPGAGGSLLFLFMCFADASASISANFQADPALFAGNGMRNLPFCRGYNWGAGTARAFVLRACEPNIANSNSSRQRRLLFADVSSKPVGITRLAGRSAPGQLCHPGAHGSLTKSWGCSQPCPRCGLGEGQLGLTSREHGDPLVASPASAGVSRAPVTWVAPGWLLPTELGSVASLVFMEVQCGGRTSIIFSSGYCGKLTWT